nr:hypothetical protein [Tanacetum cinerariifolium]
MSIGRVCNATKQMKFISEVVKVIINGEEFDVHIHELGSWSINIDDDQTSNTSESVVKEDEDVPNDDEKIEPHNNGESIHSDVANKVQGEETYQKTEEIKEVDGSDLDLSCPSGFEHFNAPLARGWSDHIPLMLHSEKVNYGPVPFKIFHSWMQRDGFKKVIKTAYEECSQGYSNRCLTFHEKLKFIKQKIKAWSHNVRRGDVSHYQEVELRLIEIEEKIDKRVASDEERQKMMNLLKKCDDLNKLQEMDTFQKARVKWDVEGDENSKFFRGILKKGINRWINEVECGALESRVTMDEIRTVVWDCGNQKAAVPKGSNSSFITLISKVANPIHIKDFQPIFLIGVQYKIIAKILANRLAEVVDKVISHEQSAFILGRQILDGPLMLSEVMDWYKSRNKKLMIFKVDFEKAYDFVSWEFLVHMLTSLGFGVKWQSWIQACLKSARSSILVNGSPSSEFSIKHSLRQGDPLSPFLFIIIMEGLHLALKDAVQSGLLRVAKARDGQYNSGIAGFLACIKIHIAKSNFCGIEVSSDDIIDMARVTWCASGTIPFIYLGLPIGSNMNLIANWQSLIDRFCGKLSAWKAKLLSIGGRLTLIQYVLGSTGIYYMSIFKCPESILKTLESIRASFFWGGCGERKKMTWVKWSHVMASLDKGAGMDGKGCKSKGMWEKLWAHILSYMREMLSLYLCYITRWDVVLPERIADGIWAWNWIRQRLGSRNEKALLSMVVEIENVSLSNQPDSWHWNIDPDGIFSVNTMRNHIDDCLLPSLSLSSRWSKVLSRKWIEDWRATKDSKDRMYVITASTLWMLWRYRNTVTFNSHPIEEM